MAERHSIYLKRRAGLPGPWTDDPVLQSGRFCNVFRELDTVTKWIDRNIRKPYADHPHLWFMLAVARYINWPDTLAELIETKQWPSHPDFDPSWLTTGLEHRAARRDKVYTGAYMIRAESNPYAEWYRWSKHRYIAEIVLGRLWEDRMVWERFLEGNPRSLQEVWAEFQAPRYIGWGPFMAYEVVTDLRHTRYLFWAPDIYTWANAGPGAIRGLNRLYERDLKAHPKPEQTNEEMWKLMVELTNYHGPRVVHTETGRVATDKMGLLASFDEVFGPTFYIREGQQRGSGRFEMRDIEHTLCEFDKYERVRLGEGKMRSKYDWRKAGRLT